MELIDRQALRAAHGLGTDCHDCKRDMKSCQYDRDYSLMDFCEWLDDAPTIDVLPVRHGEWIKRREFVEDTQFDGFRCSICNWWKGDFEKYMYCPKCGARMDGEEDA